MNIIMNIYQKKLAICRTRIFFGGRHHSRNIVSNIRELVVADKLKVTESKYTDSWVYSQKPFNDPESTSTYDGCIDLSIWEGEIEIGVWEGEMMYGDRRKKRSTFKLEGDWWLVPEIIFAVNNEYAFHAREKQREIEDAEFNARCSLMEDKLLNEFDPSKVSDE